MEAAGMPDEARGLALERRAQGVYAPELDLFLDPAVPVARAFVSHAHVVPVPAPGEPSSGTLLASRQTIGLLELLLGRSLDGARALDEAPVDVPLSRGGHARLSVAPAGHMLGASQLVVDHPGGRLVYTGDYGPGPARTHAVAAPIPCDQLVIESTYALPIFRFPDGAFERGRLVQFCRETLAQGLTPVVLALALGNAQELIAELLLAGISSCATGPVYRACEAYEALGVALGIEGGTLTRLEDGEPPPRERVVIAPMGRPKAARAVRRSKVALASGRALIDAFVDQHRADAAFVLSHHASHDELVALARATGASHVTTTSGDAVALATVLQSHGFRSSALVRAPLDDGYEA
jgi:putative mRNA 3-end processing factor